MDSRNLSKQGCAGGGHQWLQATFALFLIVSLPAAAVPPDIPLHHLQAQRWNVTEGLPQVSVQAMVQDANGVLWIGTQNGLARFDGYDFDVFRTEDHPGFRHGYVNAMQLDDEGRVWIGTEAGLSLFDGEQLHLIDDGRDTGPIRAMARAQQEGSLWLATEGGLFRADTSGLEADDRITSPLFSLLADDEGRIYLGGRGQVWIMDSGGVQEHSLPEAQSTSEVRALALLDGRLVLGTSDGLHFAQPPRPTQWLASSLPGHEVEDLVVDRHGSVWIATVSGLYRQGAEDDRPRPEISDEVRESEWLRSLLQDDEGNIWIGTQAHGILRKSVSPFRRFDARDGFIDGIVWSFYEDAYGVIWAGTNEDGAFRMRGERFEQFAGPDELPHHMVMGFLLDDEGRFWIATRAGVAWYDRETLEPMESPADLPTGGVVGIIQASDRRVWLATRDGLFWWRDGELQRIDSSKGLTQSRTRDVLEDSRGRIWVGTDTGIFRGDADGFEVMGADVPEAGLSVSSLFELDGTVWAMLQGAMLRVIGDEVHAYPDGHGLSATVSSYMLLDEHGHVWTTTHEGIQRIPLTQFDEFDRGERQRFDGELFGYLTDPVVAQCNGGHGQAGLYQPGAGALWCPSLNGALRLDLNAATRLPSAPRPRLVALRSADQRHGLGYTRQAHLVLPPEGRDLEIDFAALAYRWPAGVRYRFRLVGFDRDWQEAGTRRTAFYTNLPSGRYRFEVEATNEHGLVSSEPAVLELELSPRLHETVWFRVLLVVVFVLLVYLAWRYSVRHLRRRGRMLEDMVRDRTRQLDEKNRLLREASLTDPLTGIRNRRFLADQLPHDIAQVDRSYRSAGNQSNRDIVFLLVDLDHFKRVNDTHGHTVGDQVLIQFAQVLKSLMRESDYVVRWGGEEFLVVARQSERERGDACARRIATALKAHRFVTDKGELDIGCSIGMSVYPATKQAPRALGWEEVIELADAANYVAKAEGRNRWVWIRLCSKAAESGFMTAFRERGVTAMAEAGYLEVYREKERDD